MAQNVQGFQYPTTEELGYIGQEKIADLTQDDLLFEYMPVTTKDTDLVSWEQKDNYKGMQQLRGIGGAPPSTYRPGGKRFNMSPGYYGEFTQIAEEELTRRRAFGDITARPIDISDLVAEAQDVLLFRRITLLKYIGWTLLTTGTFSVSGRNGIVHTDSFPLQSVTVGTAWSDTANSTPLRDIRAAQLLARGYSVSFGRDSEIVMNKKMINNVLNNTNALDLGGKKMAGGATFNSLAKINEIFLENDLPTLRAYDDTYFTDDGTTTLFIPDSLALLVGKRPANQPVAEYIMTRNATNQNMEPGAYSYVWDSFAYAPKPPRTIEVHDGHNGGPAIYFPSAIIRMSI